MPPAAFTESESLGFPQEVETLVTTACSADAGWLISSVVFFVQLFASVTVTAYVPAASLFAVDNVPPDGDHGEESAPVPPARITVPLPGFFQ